MNQLEALKWLEQQDGLHVIVGKDKHVTLTDGMSVEISGTGLLDAVVKLQKTLKGVYSCKENLSY